jgi:hypothetical protein
VPLLLLLLLEEEEEEEGCLRGRARWCYIFYTMCMYIWWKEKSGAKLHARRYTT